MRKGGEEKQRKGDKKEDADKKREERKESKEASRQQSLQDLAKCRADREEKETLNKLKKETNHVYSEMMNDRVDLMTAKQLAENARKEEANASVRNVPPEYVGGRARAEKERRDKYEDLKSQWMRQHNENADTLYRKIRDLTKNGSRSELDQHNVHKEEYERSQDLERRRRENNLPLPPGEQPVDTTHWDLPTHLDTDEDEGDEDKKRNGGNEKQKKDKPDEKSKVDYNAKPVEHTGKHGIWYTGRNPSEKSWKFGGVEGPVDKDRLEKRKERGPSTANDAPVLARPPVESGLPPASSSQPRGPSMSNDTPVLPRPSVGSGLPPASSSQPRGPSTSNNAPVLPRPSVGSGLPPASSSQPRSQQGTEGLGTRRPWTGADGKSKTSTALHATGQSEQNTGSALGDNPRTRASQTFGSRSSLRGPGGAKSGGFGSRLSLGTSTGRLRGGAFGGRTGGSRGSLLAYGHSSASLYSNDNTISEDPNERDDDDSRSRQEEEEEGDEERERRREEDERRDRERNEATERSRRGGDDQSEHAGMFGSLSGRGGGRDEEKKKEDDPEKKKKEETGSVKGESE